MSTENNYFIMQLLQIHIKIQKWASFYFSFLEGISPDAIFLLKRFWYLASKVGGWNSGYFGRYS